MAKKTLMKFTGQVIAEGDRPAVQLKAYQSTPDFQNPDKNAVAELFSEVRIWRQAQPEFRFGQEYASFFDGLAPDQAELIYTGPVEWHNNRKLTWIDRDVAPGETLVYWIAAQTGPAVGPVALRVRDPEVWWSCDRIDRALRSLTERYLDKTRLDVCGESTEHRPLPVLHIGQASPALLMVGTVHAGESGPELMIPAAETLLESRPELFDQAGLILLPNSNPDMRQRLVRGTPWYLRTNANGVDLNRNFPTGWDEVHLGYGLDSSDPDALTYRGPSPTSENETRAILRLLEQTRPAAMLSCHCLASICGERWLHPLAAEGDEAYLARCRAIAEPYLRAMHPNWPEDQPLFRPGTTPGSLPHECYRQWNIPAFDLEAPLSSEHVEQCRIDQTDRALLAIYQRKHTAGLEALLEALPRL